MAAIFHRHHTHFDLMLAPDIKARESPKLLQLILRETFTSMTNLLAICPVGVETLCFHFQTKNVILTMALQEVRGSPKPL